MKHKRIYAMAALFIALITCTVLASGQRARKPIFMGEVIEIQNSESEDILRVRVKGYMKGCKVYKEEIVAIISKDTCIIKDECSTGANEKEKCKKNDKCKDREREKVNPKDFKIENGNTVFLVLSEAMTMSIPPQVNAIAIQVTK